MSNKFVELFFLADHLESFDDMDVKKTVDEWVLEYSVKNQLNTVSGGTVSCLNQLYSL